VQEQERAQDHQRVAHAEHVRARPPLGDGEHIAQEREVRVLDHVRVCELTRARVEAGPLECAPRGGHHAAVGHDRDQVQQAAQCNNPCKTQVEIAQDAGRDQRVGGQMGDPVRRRVPVRHERHDHDLDREGQESEPDRAQLQLPETRQPATGQRHRQDDQDEG
jgi:hypothetical protein